MSFDEVHSRAEETVGTMIGIDVNHAVFGLFDASREIYICLQTEHFSPSHVLKLVIGKDPGLGNPGKGVETTGKR